MAITLPLPSSQDERVFSARAKRLGVPVHEMLRYQGWEGVDLVVCDDAINARDADSETVRERTRTWWFESMSTPEADRVASVRTSQAETV